MTEADKKTLDVESHEALPWEHFETLTAVRGESRIGAPEMKRYEDCSVSPAPDNDVMVSTVFVPWSESVIATWKTSGMQDWPVAHGAYAIGMLFRSLPVGCHMEILLDSDDMGLAFQSGTKMVNGHTDPV
jgi:hypothetical protein